MPLYYCHFPAITKSESKVLGAIMVAVTEAVIGICQHVFWSETCTKIAGIHKGFQSSASS